MRMKEECKTYMAFTKGATQVLWIWMHVIWVNKTHLPPFQYLMETCFGDLQLSWCIIYLDDIIVFAAILKEHLEKLQAVFTKLRGAGLKLKLNKCGFFNMEIVCLGHVVSKDGVWMDECKIKAVRKWPVLHTIMEARAFLGFCQLLLSVPEGLCLCYPSIVWAAFRRQCEQEKLVGAVD